MRTVYNLLQAAKALELEIIQINAMVDAKQDLIDLQKDQLADGQRSDDKAIFNVKTGKDTYSPEYALYKGFTKPINLKDTGNFYNGIYADPNAEGLLIDSKDSKSNMLQERYGDEIFGLNKGRKPEWLEVVSDNMLTTLHNELKI